MQVFRQQRIGVLAVLAVGVLLGAVVDVSASPAINSAVFKTRIFNDDPGSTLTTTDTYPTTLSISDTPSIAAGFANRHNFRLSTDNVFAAQFQNGDRFAFSADLTVSGAGEGEAGLQISPWWSGDVDGMFNFRTTDGEIAVFGGRLPFYSFTGNHGITYTKGTTVRAGVDYRPNSLSAADPATIEYTVTIGATTYSSGMLAFDEGNPGEDPPHGLWGMLSPAYVGGHMQMFLGSSGVGNTMTTTWSNISYVPEPTSVVLLGLGALVMRRRR